MILTYHIAYIAVIAVLLAIIVCQNIDKLHAVKAFGKAKIILFLFLLCIAGVISYKIYRERIERKKGPQNYMRVIPGAVEMRGMEPPPSSNLS